MFKLKAMLTKICQTTPVGKVDMYAGSTAPTGWLLCNGQAVSRTTYAALFNVIGTTYGTGDGSTTFNVPDFRNRMPIGAGDTYSRNSAGGSKDAIVPYHRHSVNEITSGEPSNNTTTGMSANSTGSFVAYAYGDGSSSGSMSITGKNKNAVVSGGSSVSHVTYKQTTSHTHGMQKHTHKVESHNTNYAGASGNTTNANLPPYRGIFFIIYAGGGN